MKCRVLVVLLALVLGACSADPPEPAGSAQAHAVRPPGNGENRNVLLVTIDTLRADRLGVYGHPGGATPQLDALARDGVTFTAAYSPVPLTLPAHTSLMTGTYPLDHGVRDNVGYRVPDTVQTLAETLAAAGYRTGAFVSSFVLDSRWGLDQGFESYHDGFEIGGGLQPVGGGQEGLEWTADQTVARAIDWLDEGDDERPFFLWVHLFDPHAPYDPPAEYRTRFATTPYLGEIAFTDAQVGRLLERLGGMGQRDRTVIVVTGDHGEGLGEHGEVEHGLFIYEESLRVPLIIAAPAGAARGLIRSTPVSLVDVTPTIVDLVSSRGFGTAQGTSLVPALDAAAEVPSRTIYAESLYGERHYGWSALRGLIGDRYKLIESSDPELYDLPEDPEESDNQAGELNSVYLRMHQELLDFEERSTGGHVAESGPVDAETQAKLAALGYIGSVRAPSTDSLDARPSPRARIDVYNRVLEAGSAMKAAAFGPAERLLTEALAVEPGMLEAQRLLGQVYTELGRPADAARVFRRAVPLNPSDEQSYLLLADALASAGDLAGAERALVDGLALIGASADLQVTLGSVRAQQGNLAEARQAFRVALELEPDAEHAYSGLAQVEAALGEFDSAAEHARRALALDPTMPRAHFILAEAARQQGDFERAIGEYRAELGNQPGNLIARINLAMSYRQLGRSAEEMAALEEAVRVAPLAPPGNLMLARALIEQNGNLQRAADLLTRMLDRPLDDQERVIGYALMAEVSSRLGDTEGSARWRRLHDELVQQLGR